VSEIAQGDTQRAGARGRGGRFVSGSIVLAAALIAAGAALAVVALRGPAPPTTMAERVRVVASALRCPVCQNLTVADSPSRLAQEMRQTIARDLRAGKTPQEVRQGFARAYGDWILEAPPKRGINLVAWIGPALLVLIGLGVASAAVWRWTGRGLTDRTVPAPTDQSGGKLSGVDRALLDRAMASGAEEAEAE
jgi:cytochrome c-type biogenesis protein CcmH